MRLSDLIRKLRVKLADEEALYWKDVVLAEELNTQARGLYRTKADADLSYGARVFRMNAIDDGDNIEQIDLDIFLYNLPSWVHKVAEVKEELAVNSLVTIEPVESNQDAPGWYFFSDRTIAVRGRTYKTSLWIKCQKLPSLMARGTFLQASADQRTIFVPTTLAIEAGQVSAFPLEQEKGSMLGAKLEITSSSLTHDPRGVIGVVIAQSKQLDAAGTAWTFQLQVRPKFPDNVAIGDTWQSHCDIEDAHAEYLLLRAACALHQSRHNIVAENVLRYSLDEERRKFENTLTPRATTLHLMATEDRPYSRIDLDRDNSVW